MPRPDKTAFTAATVTEAQFKTAMDSLVDWLGLMCGAVDDYLNVASGTQASRPSATEGGWLRFNTDNNVLDITIGTTWNKVVHSIIDTTWWLYFSTSLEKVIRLKSTNASNIATSRIENNAGDYVDVERTAAKTIVRSSGTDPVEIIINGVTVFSIDSSGNVIALGNVTAYGSP